MKNRNILSYLLLILLGGCVPVSLNPLYTADTLTFEEKLIGKWSEPDCEDLWEFRKADGNSYEVRVVSNGRSARFEGHLVDLDGALFLDLYPEELDIEDDLYKLHFVPVHTFFRVYQIDPNLQLCLMEPHIFAEDPNALKHEDHEDYILITASTEEIQEFLIDHANDTNVFDFNDASNMNRRVPFYCEEDIIFDEKLIGTWEGKDGEIFDSVKDCNAYNILFVDEDGDEYEAAAQLVELKGVMLLAIFLDPSPIKSPDPYNLHLIPDYFMKVDQIEPQLLLEGLDYQEVSEIVNGHQALTGTNSSSADYFFEGSLIEY